MKKWRRRPADFFQNQELIRVCSCRESHLLRCCNLTRIAENDMTCARKEPLVEPVNIVLALAYVTTLFVLLGWIATLLI